MFALVIWDRVARRAFVARDPYGIKPLYSAVTSNGVMLASQVKALLATGCVAREPNPQGQLGFWLLGSVPDPLTWYRDIAAIPAGHYGCCLLYTSPSPRDRTRSRMPSSA